MTPKYRPRTYPPLAVTEGFRPVYFISTHQRLNNLRHVVSPVNPALSLWRKRRINIDGAQVRVFHPTRREHTQQTFTAEISPGLVTNATSISYSARVSLIGSPSRSSVWRDIQAITGKAIAVVLSVRLRLVARGRFARANFSLVPPVRAAPAVW